MEVILLENVKKLGKKFETVSVKKGYALNFLIPKGLAGTATSETLQSLKREREIHEELKAKEAEEIKNKISSLNNSSIVIQKKVNDQGHLFAGISKEDIAEEFSKETSINLDPSYILLEHGIKEVGEYEIPVNMKEQSFSFKVTVEGEN